MTTRAIDFTLDRHSNLEVHAQEGDMRASVEKGSSRLRVEGVEAASEDAARNLAEIFANKFLNTLAYKWDEALGIAPLPWASEPTGEPGNKSVHVGNSISSRSSLTLTKIDAGGNVVEVYDSDRPGKIEVSKSEAAAYYRRAALAGDPFDKFRNFYLVAENVADQIRLAKQCETPKEQSLLREALETCFAANSGLLVQVAEAVPGFVAGTDVFNGVAELLYKAHRCQLSPRRADSQ